MYEQKVREDLRELKKCLPMIVSAEIDSISPYLETIDNALAFMDEQNERCGQCARSTIKTDDMLRAEIRKLSKSRTFYVDGKGTIFPLEGNETFFKTEETFIWWISAYYPAPKGFVKTNDEHLKNVESWTKYFENMRIASGEDREHEGNDNNL